MEFDLDIFDAVELYELTSIKMYWQESTNIDWQDIRGRSLLILAAHYGDPEIIQYLLSKNPNPDLKDKHGKTALDIAREDNKTEAIKLLEAYESTLLR